MIIIQVRGQQSFEMSFVEDDDRIQNLSTQATNYALDIGVLPRRSRRGDNLVNAQARHPSLNPIAIYAIAVSQQIVRRRIERKRFYNDSALASSRGISFSAKVRPCVVERKTGRYASGTRISRERTKSADQVV